MEYQKMTNLLGHATNQPSKFRTTNWVERNDDSKVRYDNINIRFKTCMITSNLCDYRDSYIFVERTTAVLNTAAAGVAVNNTNKKVLFKNCASFFDCITEMNNIQIDDAQKIGVVIPRCNWIESSDAYSKT